MIERKGPGEAIRALTPLQRAERMRALRSQEGTFDKDVEIQAALAKKEPTDGPNAVRLETSEIRYQELRTAATRKKGLKSRF